MAEYTDLVRLALLVVIDDETELTSCVLLAILKLAIHLDLVALYSQVMLATTTCLSRRIKHVPPGWSWPTLVMCLGLAEVLVL